MAANRHLEMGIFCFQITIMCDTWNIGNVRSRNSFLLLILLLEVNWKEYYNQRHILDYW